MSEASANTNGRPDALVREVMDVRNLVIKNANVLTSLNVELRGMARELQKQQRGLRVQAIAAVVAALLLGWGLFHFVYRGRVEQLELEKAAVQRQLGAAQADLERSREQRLERARAEKKALDFYQRITAGSARGALEDYSQVSALPLSKVEAAHFADWVQRKRNQLGYSAYADGMRAIGQNEYKEAVTAFQRSLELLPDPPHAASLYYYQGIALAKLGSYLDAAQALQRAIDHGAERTVSNQVRFHLGSAFEMLGQRDRAQQAYNELVKRYPNAPHAAMARARLKALAARPQ